MSTQDAASAEVYANVIGMTVVFDQASDSHRFTYAGESQNLSSYEVMTSSSMVNLVKQVAAVLAKKVAFKFGVKCGGHYIHTLGVCWACGQELIQGQLPGHRQVFATPHAEPLPVLDAYLGSVSEYSEVKTMEWKSTEPAAVKWGVLKAKAEFVVLPQKQVEQPMSTPIELNWLERGLVILARGIYPNFTSGETDVDVLRLLSSGFPATTRLKDMIPLYPGWLDIARGFCDDVTAQRTHRLPPGCDWINSYAPETAVVQDLWRGLSNPAKAVLLAQYREQLTSVLTDAYTTDDPPNRAVKGIIARLKATLKDSDAEQPRAPTSIQEQYKTMNPTIRQAMSAITARVAIVIIRTTDEEAVAEALTHTLAFNGHRTTEWSAVLGSRQGVIAPKIDQLKPGEAWDAAAAGDPTGILGAWIEGLQKGEDDIRHCASCKTTAPEKARGDVCKKHNCSAPTPRVSDRTLILRGAAHFIAPEGRFFDPTVVRSMWDVAQLNYQLYSNLILLLPSGAPVPDVLLQHAKLIDDALPSRTEIMTSIWPAFLEALSPTRRVVFEALVEPAGLETSTLIADRLTGLSRPEVALALKQGIVTGCEAIAEGGDGWSAFLKVLADTKAEGVKKCAALEIMTPANPDELGGVPTLRGWLSGRRKAFSPEAKLAGIPAPKGVLLLGSPGTGKSLAAKATAAVLGFPLLKLDFGALFGGLVGQSEAQVRQALAVVNAAAPCVLLVDEIDKALGGTGGESTDGGTTQRVFGTFLTWMQERDSEHPVFVVASANDVRRIPPEMMRKGRFDEIFFIDLPSPDERRAILQIHMNKANKAAGQLVCELDEGAWEQAITATAGFVGAELEQAVKEARIAAFDAGEEFEPAHLFEAFRNTKPLSHVMREQIDSVRNWAKDRARRATPESVPTPVAGGLNFKREVPKPGNTFQNL